jgi:multidrug efflux system membrane fusion protein
MPEQSVISSARPCAILALRLLVFGGFLNACGKPAESPPAAPQSAPVAVKAAKPILRDVVEEDVYSGRIEAIETVEIRARVNGFLEKIAFRDGASVQKGDLLFVIDPRPYRAELDRTRAGVEQARAALTLARENLARGEKLIRTRAISSENYDSLNKNVRESGALLHSAEAELAAARINLDYTEIRAPISGRISRRLITLGNLVSDSTTLLATLVSVDPVYVYLDADEAAALRYRRAAGSRHRPEAAGAYPSIAAELGLIDETGFPHRGRLDYSDPGLDPATGTLKLRGTFPNPDGFLIPGLYARVRVPGGAPKQALLIPDRAIAVDQDRKFVWIAKDDDLAEYRAVVPGTKFGSLRVIAAGLGPGDRVVVEGLQKLRPGVRVKPEIVPIQEGG